METARPRAACEREGASAPKDGFATISGDRADLEFRRSQRSLRLAAVSRLQSRASSLWTDEPNDHAGPNQRPLREFAGCLRCPQRSRSGSLPNHVPIR